MKHSGKAGKAALKLILIPVLPLVVIIAAGFLFLPGTGPRAVFAGVLAGLWVLFTLFTLYFFRDPEARVPAGANLVLAPGHGKVDVIGTTTEPEFMLGDCQRIS